MNNNYQCLVILLFVCLQTGLSQNIAINKDGSPPHPGAILDVSADSSAVLLPRADTSSILNPVRGFIIYDTTIAGFRQFNGIRWLRLMDESAFTFYFRDYDGDGYGDKFDPLLSFKPFPGFVPDSTDCDDMDPFLSPGVYDLCDGIDNDCDPGSADGSNDPVVGTPCDGPDADLCEEGVWICSGGALSCTDLTNDNIEYCDSIDNDCDGMIDEGCVAVTISWGNIQWPASTTTTVDTPTQLIFGQVYAVGITDSPGQGPGILAQLGYGADGSDPAQGGWTWVNANYNKDFLNNDEYMATLTVGTAGTYDYAYRYSGDGGISWLYADFDPGTSNGYSTANAGDLTVNP